MQIDQAYLNSLLLQGLDYFHHNHLHALYAAVAGAVFGVWLILKIYYRIKLKNLGKRLGSDIAAKEQERQQLHESLEASKSQLAQAETDLGTQKNQIEQLETAKASLQNQVDQFNRAKTAIYQSCLTLQTNFAPSDIAPLNAEDDVDKMCANLGSIAHELNQRLKSFDLKNTELQQINQQNTAKLAEQEITIHGLENAAQKHSLELITLKQNFETERLSLEQQFKELEATIKSNQSFLPKHPTFQNVVSASEEVADNLSKSVEQLAETAIEKVQAVEEQIQSSIAEKVAPTIAAAVAIEEKIIETVTTEQKNNNFFRSLKKSLNIGDKPVKPETPPSDTHDDVYAKLRAEEKPAEPVKQSKQETAPKEKKNLLPSFKNLLGSKKSADSSPDSSAKSEATTQTSSPEPIKTDSPKDSTSKFKSLFGKTQKKPELAKVVEDAQEELSESGEKLAEIFKEETQEAKQAITQATGQVKGFLKKFNFSK